MKKRSAIILLIIFFSIPFIWLVSLIRCEVLTRLHGNEFLNIHKETNMLDEIEFLRVLDYTKSRAQIYYAGADKSSGDIVGFVRCGDIWEFNEWETVWSSQGSADGIIWPYLYDSPKGTLVRIAFGMPLLIIIIGLLCVISKSKQPLDRQQSVILG